MYPTRLGITCGPREPQIKRHLNRFKQKAVLFKSHLLPAYPQRPAAPGPRVSRSPASQTGTASQHHHTVILRYDDSASCPLSCTHPRLSTPGVSKPPGHLQPPSVFVSNAHSCTFRLWLRQVQDGVVVTEPVRPTKPNPHSTPVSWTPHGLLEKPVLVFSFLWRNPELGEERPAPGRQGFCPVPSTQSRLGHRIAAC